ncbi:MULTISPECIES: hypothetical protein [unclassified Pseudomonas]|uniref:hypothetical protein n=1 Tax=unclassified Pseudomonas TaxID=196821 RepID=UPI0011AF6124|nr:MULTISPECIES: hypothetical protein [unclassified Pseudomonas]
MLSIEYVKELVEKHQEKAADHIERLKAKIENKDNEVSDWVYDEDITLYWSHPDVLYLPLNSCDFINYYLRGVHAVSFIMSLEKITNADRDKLEGLYFEHVSDYWKKQGVTRSGIPKGFASEGFLDRVFKI